MSKRTVAKNYADIEIMKYVIRGVIIVVAILVVYSGWRSWSLNKLDTRVEVLEGRVETLDEAYGAKEAAVIPPQDPTDGTLADPPPTPMEVDPEPTPEHYKHSGEVVCENHCWHEVAHKYYWEDLNSDERQEFEYAVRRFLHRWTSDVWETREFDENDHPTYELQTHPLLKLVVTFPGFFEDYIGDEGTWGGYVELYADIFAFYDGGYRSMPQELDDFYGFRRTLEYYWMYRPEHFNGEFCADWAFQQRDPEDDYEYCMVEVRQ